MGMAVAAAIPPQQPYGHGQHHDAAEHDERDADPREMPCLRHELRPGVEQVEYADGDERRTRGVQDEQAQGDALPVQFDGFSHARASRKRAATQLDQAAMLIEGGAPGEAGSAAASTT